MNSANQLVEDNIPDILTTQNRVSNEHNSSDPITKSKINVTLDKIRPYLLNPRKIKNPKFDELLQAIENAGLKQPPSITRRNLDDEFYMIHNGGNTRLEVLNVLYKKYSSLAHDAINDEEKLKYTEKANSFYYLNWEFEPWVSEIHAFMGHMGENETHGKMFFVERAASIKKSRELYAEYDRKLVESEGGIYEYKPLSTRKLANRMTKDGWPVSYSHIPRYDYSNEFLADILPEALLAGMGHSIVVEIRKYDDAYNEYWMETDEGKNNPDIMKDLFFNTLRNYDGNKIVLKAFVNELNQNINDITGVTNNSIMTEVEAIISGIKNKSLSSEIFDNANSKDPLKDYINTSPNNKPKPNIESFNNPVADISNQNSMCTEQVKSVKIIIPKLLHEQEDLLFKLVKELSAKFEITVVKIPSTTCDAAKCNIFGVAPMDALISNDDAAVIWWYLTKMSRAYRAAADNYYEAMTYLNSAMEKMYAQYINKMGLLGTILYLEERLVELNPDVRSSLNAIHDLVEHIHHLKYSK